MARRWIVLPVVGFGVIAGSVGGYTAWSAGVWTDLMPERTAELTDETEEASSTVQAYLRSCARGHEAASQWLGAEVAYAADRHDLPRLLDLWNGETEPLRANEEAAWLTCRGLLLEGRVGEVQRVRELWRGRETQPARWVAFDADRLLCLGQPEQARTLLLNRRFPGADDAGRLALLALTVDSPAEAHQLLNRAAALAPADPDVHVCRGRLLESEGQLTEAAAEFTAALAVRADDWVLRDRLAECYRRAGDYAAAAATLLPADGVEQADFAWLRAWFWSRVMRPVDRDWEATAPTLGALRSLAAHLVELPADQFWTIGAHRRPGLREPVATRQETYWLRVLALLQSGREAEATYLLNTAPYRQISWQPDLERALDQVLTFRAGGMPQATADGYSKGRHPFFSQLETLAGDGQLTRRSAGLPADVARLLTGPEAFAALLLAAGWDEAALLLHHDEADLSQLPGWYGEGIIRAEWTNRDRRTALLTGLRQRRTPALDLVTGELLVAEGRRAEGLQRLQAATRDPETGPRAAWQFARVALEEKRPADARQALESYPQLTSNVEGLTLLARCAVAEGHDDRAEQLYRELSDESAEARSYLARRAMAGGDWAAAGRLLRDSRP